MLVASRFALAIHQRQLPRRDLEICSNCSRKRLFRVSSAFSSGIITTALTFPGRVHVLHLFASSCPMTAAVIQPCLHRIRDGYLFVADHVLVALRGMNF